MNAVKLDPVMMLRAGPGTLPRWSRYTIALASVITVAVMALGGQLIVGELAWYGQASPWLNHRLAIAAAVAIAVCFAPPSSLSRFLRLSVLLPLIHGVLVIVAWEVWQSTSQALARHSDGRAFATWFPFYETTVLAAVIYVAGAVLVARRREWLHALTTLSLSSLLLLGLWMPIVSTTATWVHPVRTALWMALPPFMAATGFTYLSLRRPLPSAKLALGVALAIAVLARIDATPTALVVYANYVPLLVVALLLATGSLAALAIVTLVRAQVARAKFASSERLVGVVDCADQGPVVALEVASWLRAPRVVQRSFAIATSAGTIPVSGADLIAPLPAATTLLARGETLGIIHGGDAVVVAGHAHASGDPFRTSASPLAGDLAIAPADVERAGLTSMTLAMWRPCVAYLLIVTVVALPGLAALLS